MCPGMSVLPQKGGANVTLFDNLITERMLSEITMTMLMAIIWHELRMNTHDLDLCLNDLYRLLNRIQWFEYIKE